MGSTCLRGLSSTRSWCARARRPPQSLAAAHGGGLQLSRVDAARSSHRASTKRRPTMTSKARARSFGASHGGPRGAAAHGIPESLRAPLPLSHAARFRALSLGDRAPALHARARRQGPRARPHDDSARFVHDEAERDHRDDPHHVARSSRTCTRSRRATNWRATRRSRASSSAICARSPATTRFRSSRTRVRRASSPACSRSAPITRVAASLTRNDLPHPELGARHEPRVGADGGHEGRRGELRRARQRRSRGPARQGRAARRVARRR